MGCLRDDAQVPSSSYAVHVRSLLGGMYVAALHTWNDSRIQQKQLPAIYRPLEDTCGVSGLRTWRLGW